MASGPPPAALLQFLGEAPSAAALRRPSSGAAKHPPPQRGCGEDSSPDTPGLPQEDGGFDDFVEYSGATTAETELFTGSSAPNAGSGGKSRAQKPVKTVKPPKGGQEPSKVPGGGYAAPAQARRSGSKPPEIEDFSKTSTPLPEGAARMFCEESPSGVRRGQAKSRPRSGSRNRVLGNSASMRDLDETPPTSAASAAVDYDPMGSSMGRRRFGGRG
mmetsp:Transcript_36838/g.68612  ORF Transcript_36838/g.68612 Transcript_36838/m.68612 type:complete len:216 (+) Transcript_36838:64-711(+)